MPRSCLISSMSNRLKIAIVKEELKLKLIKTISEFKSKEEPKISLNTLEIINVLSSIIERKTQV